VAELEKNLIDRPLLPANREGISRKVQGDFARRDRGAVRDGILKTATFSHFVILSEAKDLLSS
jgi:hypothetical protein